MRFKKKYQNFFFFFLASFDEHLVNVHHALE